MKRALKHHLSAEVERQVQELAQRSLQELRELPSRTDTSRRFEGQSYVLTIWRDDMEGDRVAIGVFVDVPGPLWSRSCHDGFLMSPDGTRSPMPIDMQVKHI